MLDVNLFQEAHRFACQQGRKPDAWWIGGHIDAVRTEDGWRTWKEGDQMYGLPMKRSFKLKPGEVVLAEGAEIIVLFGAPCALDLTRQIEQHPSPSKK